MSNTSPHSETEQIPRPTDELGDEDFAAAFELIADIAPELMEYIITYYPPELMIHISPELCHRLEQLEKSSYHPD